MASNMTAVRKKMEKSKISNAQDKAVVKYFPLKMVQDKKTEMYIKFAKVMVLVQGSYTEEREKNSELIEKTFKHCSAVVSDKKFTSSYNKACSYKETKLFYDYFRCMIRRALENCDNLLLIDSTVPNSDLNKYCIAFAYKMQYIVLVVPPVVMNASDCSEVWPKNSLAASFRDEAKKVIQPTNVFQHLFCAWYLHDVDSYELRDNASLYIKDCLEGIEEFHTNMKENCSKIGVDGEELIDAVRQYYNLTDKRQDLAFCAVKMFDCSMELVNEYFEKHFVANNYGKMSKLYIVGYIISPEMIAARVRLTHAQKDLWEMVEEIDENTFEISRIQSPGPFKILENLKKELPDIDVETYSTKSQQSLCKANQTVHDPLQTIHPSAKGRACHIVLGKSSDARPLHVDYGVQFALNKERRFERSKTRLNIHELEDCVVKKIDKYWFIYLREVMTVDALFASCVKSEPVADSVI
ncbi:2' like protein [Argiope bruennichi]|uniref:2' like protein n=1 Tax=Argiope bruennichi TaxID=94029 RepID=A0A8T0F922_ARGBR|nr:2' like protein [Argiope bruennichi]